MRKKKREKKECLTFVCLHEEQRKVDKCTRTTGITKEIRLFEMFTMIFN